MKAFRISIFCCLLIVGSSGISGCATTEHTDNANKQEQGNAWKDMTTAEKVAVIPLWILAEFAYALGESGYSFTP